MCRGMHSTLNSSNVSDCRDGGDMRGRGDVGIEVDAKIPN